MILRYGDLGFWEGLFMSLKRFLPWGSITVSLRAQGEGERKGWLDIRIDVMSDFDSTMKDCQVISKISFIWDLCGFTYNSN